MHVPSSAWKNPLAQAAQSVPLLAVVYPALHVHPPLPSQTPFWQLQLAGASVTFSVRQTPEPAIPSAHWAQVGEQGVQAGPKWPGRHDSHEEPVKPGAQVHVGCVELELEEGEQTPPEAHAVWHAVDWRASTESWPAVNEDEEGNCARSGMES